MTNFQTIFCAASDACRQVCALQSKSKFFFGFGKLRSFARGQKLPVEASTHKLCRVCSCRFRHTSQGRGTWLHLRPIAQGWFATLFPSSNATKISVCTVAISFKPKIRTRPCSCKVISSLPKILQPATCTKLRKTCSTRHLEGSQSSSPQRAAFRTAYEGRILHNSLLKQQLDNSSAEPGVRGALRAPREFFSQIINALQGTVVRKRLRAPGRHRQGCFQRFKSDRVEKYRSCSRGSCAATCRAGAAVPTGRLSDRHFANGGRRSRFSEWALLCSQLDRSVGDRYAVCMRRQK